VSAFDLAVIATAHKTVNYQELADWSPCIVDTRNASKGLTVKPGQIFKA
jgi:UDP-N-acetyl-D-glucosamine dehydrogenase